jgi:hypothetical protein
MFRIREAGLKMAIMREVMLYYRIRPGSLTETDDEDQKKRNILRALHLTISRRRSAGRSTDDLPPFTSLIEE